MTEDKEFSHKLRGLREAKGISQEKLAELVEVSTMTIRRWEWGERQPRLDEIKRLAKVFSCTETELLNGSQPDGMQLVVSWNWEDMKKGEINMNDNKFELILGKDGKVGLQGAGLITSREAIEEFLSRVRTELEIALDAQVKRGVVPQGA